MPAPDRTLRILLADDNPVNRMLIELLLKRRGHTVCTASNGLEAVAMVQRENLDIVLMDMQMPQMDGYQATAAIRDWEQGRRQPVCIVALTATLMDADKDCALHGFDFYLPKPFSPAELDEVLARGTGRIAA